MEDKPKPQIDLDDRLTKTYRPRGDAKVFKQSKYLTEGLVYPSDLHSDDNYYGGNYVVFYVNVHEDSKLVRDGVEGGFVGNVVRRDAGFVAESNLSSAAITGTAVAAGGIAGAASNFTGAALKATGLELTDAGQTVTQVGSGLLGAAAVKVALNQLGRPNAQYKRQKKAIALYLPQLSSRYSVVWREGDVAGTLAVMGLAEGGISAVQNMVNALQGDNSDFSTAGKSIQSALAYAAGTLTSLGGGVGEVVQKTTGTAPNPKKEQLFKEVNFRTFSFNYQFLPRTPAEAKAVREIIKEFKLHMHPEYRLDTGQFLYVYPSEFDIRYYHNGKENLNLYRHTSCVLTDLNVNYGSQGQMTTFSDGMPTEVNLQLTFKELALLTKEHIQDNF